MQNSNFLFQYFIPAIFDIITDICCFGVFLLPTGTGTIGGLECFGSDKPPGETVPVITNMEFDYCFFLYLS